MRLDMKYNRPPSVEERLILSDRLLLAQYLKGLPQYIVMNIKDIVAPLNTGAFPVTDDVKHWVFQAAQVKRDITEKMDQTLGEFQEYYFDDYYAYSHDDPKTTHEQYSMRVRIQGLHAELAMHHAIYHLTMMRMYKDDFLFPYDYSRMFDRDSALFTLMQGPIL